MSTGLHLPTMALTLAVAAALVALWWLLARQRARNRGFLSDVDRATYATLHTASLAAGPLREGLTPEGARTAAGPLRSMLGTTAIAICDLRGPLVWEGDGEHHRDDVLAHIRPVLDTGNTIVQGARVVACTDSACPVRAVVVSPLFVDQHVVGALAAYGPQTSAGLAQACDEMAQWVSTQLDIAQLSGERTRAMAAELQALRAQISPHFIYNSLAAIASFVRTDPDRARELLLEFADFTRYALRRDGAFTTLSDELRNTERYLVLEQARFGDRLGVSLLIAPEVLPVQVPYLAIQPLVENAVRHGLTPKEGAGHLSISARDLGAHAEIVIDDDGVGADPERIRDVLDGAGSGDNVGLGNVDARLRQVYGEEYGLLVETAPGAGTTVTFRVPKYAPGVIAAS